MNILTVMCDEMSWWGMGHENPAVHTPNLDALAARGARFTSAYTPSPICVPARASVATGKYVHEIGCWSSAQAYDGSVRGWAHSVRDAGYDCVSIGKLHYRNGDDDTGFGQQIEPIHIPNGVGWLRGLLRNPLCSYDATAELADMIGAGDSEYLQFDRRVTAKSVEWLADPARQKKPWAAFISFLCPHYPLIAPQEYYDMYDPEAFEVAAVETPNHPILREILTFFNHDEFFTPRTRGIAIASYYALCTFLDAQVGKVLDALNASGMGNDTLVLFTSDHGEMLGEKGFWTKSNMYESSARVPLLLAGPEIKPDVRDDPVSLIDIAPTIANAMGLSVRGYSGQDLRMQPSGSRTVLSEYHDGGCSVGITMVRWNDGVHRWKYIHYAQGNPAHLFDLQNDPQEMTNLARNNPETCAEGLRRLARWMDPEIIDARAHADQAKLIKVLGGRDAILDKPQWNFTPADSR